MNLFTLGNELHLVIGPAYGFDHILQTTDGKLYTSVYSYGSSKADDIWTCMDNLTNRSAFSELLASTLDCMLELQHLINEAGDIILTAEEIDKIREDEYADKIHAVVYKVVKYRSREELLSEEG